MNAIPEIVAHRGAGRTAVAPVAHRAHRPAAPPENTLPALDRGWGDTSSCELDVRLTRDNQLLAIHDPTTGRICDRDLEVAASDLSELTALDAGAATGAPWTGTRLATLEEALERRPAGKRLWVEIKTGPGILDPLLALHERHPFAPRRLVFLSFHLDTLARIKRSLPELTCHLVLRFDRGPDGWRAKIRGVDPRDRRGLASRDLWLPSEEGEPATRLCERLVEIVHHPPSDTGEAPLALDGLDVSRLPPEEFFSTMTAAGVSWGAWGVDEAATAVRLAALGAVQLTTDDPLDLRHALVAAADA